MDFSKKFVCEDLEYSTFQKNVPAPLFRKSFFLESLPDEAEILICGLGFYDLFVNGQKITKGHIAPYVSNPDHILYYDAYDLKRHLCTGENVIGVMLGDGFQVGKTHVWNFVNNITNAPPMLAVSAEIKCAGKLLRFEADDFVCKKGPIYFNDYRTGVFYDARLEEKGWCRPGFSEEGWHKPLSGRQPSGTPKLCEAEPVRVQREIKPVSVTPGSMKPYVLGSQTVEVYSGLRSFEPPVPLEGGYIYDFGENNSGIFRLKIRGTRGQRIDIQCAEQLTGGEINIDPMEFYPDGFCQRDVYILSGEDEEVFEPMFTFHGFRYLYVTGITEEQATPDLLTFLVMSSDLEERGTFSCSDETANAIYQMARRSDISNFFYFPLDCPHREKNGWTGDASLSAEHMIMTIGAENSWREWLHNIRVAQKPEGDIPGIVPTGEWGYDHYTSGAWDNVLVNLPYYAYVYRGDQEIILENASSIMRYLEFADGHCNDDGIYYHGALGDWCPVGNLLPGGAETDLGYINNVMLVDMCRKAEFLFRTAGLCELADRACKIGIRILQSVRKKFIDSNTCQVSNRCQTAQALALYYDIFTEEEKPQGFRVLMDILKEDNHKLTCGVVGARVLFHVLSQFGQTELAYEMITTKDFPGYGYWAAKGETTLLEAFLEYDDRYPMSKNHHFWGDIVNWFMSKVGGLQVVSSNQVKVDPFFVKRLDWCRTSHKLPDGEIEISWKRQGDTLKLQVKSTGNVIWELARKDGYVYTLVSANTYLLKEQTDCIMGAESNEI